MGKNIFTNANSVSDEPFSLWEEVYGTYADDEFQLINKTSFPFYHVFAL